MATEPPAHSMKSLRILMLEDTPTDAELMEREVRKAGISFTSKRVDTRDAFIAALKEFQPDIVLSDYRVPGFDGLSALQLARRDYPDIPVIMVTGALSDIEAVELLHSGARDYVLKDRLARLAPAIQHVLSAEMGVRARKAAELALHDTYRQVELARDEWNTAFDAVHDPIFFHDKECRVTRCNRAYARRAGMPFKEIIGRFYWEVFPEGGGPLASCRNEMADLAAQVEEEVKLDTGETFISRSFSARDASGGYLFSVHIMEDITERKRAEELIRKNNQLLETVFSSIHVMIAYLDREFNFIKVNKVYADADHRTPDFFPGKNHFDLFPNEENKAIFQKVVETGEPAIYYAKAFEYAEHPERGVGYWDWRLEPIKGADGKAEGLLLSLQDVTEQTLAVQKIQAASKYARSLIEASLDPLVTISAEGKITDVNEATEQATGRSRAELIGTDFSDYFTEPDKAREGYQQVFQKGYVTDYPLAIHRKDGRIMDVLYNASVYRDDAGRVMGVFAAARDITARKQAEAMRTQLAAIVESSSDAIIGKTPDGIITSWNKGAENIYGYSAAEIIGKHITTLVPPEGHAEINGLLEKVRQGETVVNHESERIRKDGALIQVAVTLSPIRDASGNITGISTIARNITEKKQMEEKLRLASAYNRSLIEASLDPLVTISAEGKITDVNEATEQATGRSRAELIGTDFSDYFTEPDKAREGYQQVFQKGYVTDYPLAIHRKDGRIMDVLYNASVYRDDAGRVMGVFAAARDITERKRAEAALQRLNRALKARGAGNHALVHSVNEKELMQGICRAATDSDNYPLAWVGRALQDGKKSIAPVAIAGAGQGYVNELRVTWADEPLGRGPTGLAVRMGETQICQDFVNDPRMTPWREAAAKYGLASSIALPLRENGVITGALTLYAAEPGAFDSQEVALLEEMTEDLAFGLATLRTRTERDHALEERQHYADRLRSSLEEALQAIAATVEMRDPYTAGHQRRVSQFATAIAREMGLSDEQTHGIHLAGIVHDLGKIHIPAEVLSKPGRLNEIEFSFIKIHPQAGYDILKEIEFPWPIAQTVLQHHERIDGSGYPQGLKGDAIILEARILAVADLVEAMASHRPYRPGLGLDAALSEITARRGTLFDPAVVDACLNLFEKRGYVLPG